MVEKEAYVYLDRANIPSAVTYYSYLKMPVEWIDELESPWLSTSSCDLKVFIFLFHVWLPDKD